VASSLRVAFDGTPADDDFYTKLATLEVEENADLPGALQMRIPVTTGDAGDLTMVGNDRFKPFANVTVVVTPDGGGAQCLFDGYLLSYKLHLETGAVASTLDMWGQDASWLMNLEERVREWSDVTDGDVANAIFGDYGVTPDDQNTSDDSPMHTEDGHTLMQRASDIVFLRRLAHANGKLCRVACRDTPGARYGTFARPKLDGDPDVTISMADPTNPGIDALDVAYDVTRPTTVKARQALFDDSSEDGAGVEETDSGLAPLDARTPADFAGRPMTALLTAPVDSADELSFRAKAMLADAAWFVRCEGEADAGKLGTVLRVGMIAEVDGIGALHSGKYLVWSVRHTITGVSHTMKFVFVRNAVGPPSAAGGGLLGGLP
jgi:phage protein D